MIALKAQRSSPKRDDPFRRRIGHRDWVEAVIAMGANCKPLFWRKLAAVGEDIIAQASVDPVVVKVPVVNGSSLHYNLLSTAQGLSQTKINQIVEDRQGFMWFATQYGLNRYDGYKFKVFVNVPGNPN